jgi:hypothetical protein
VQLLYLKAPLAITTEPTDRSTRGTRRTLGAVWQAVERACDREDFRPQPSRLCDYCAFQAYCPSFGGDPAEARRVAEQRAAGEHSDSAPPGTAGAHDRGGPGSGASLADGAAGTGASLADGGPGVDAAHDDGGGSPVALTAAAAPA